MEEGQKNRFLSKSSIENSQFMTNVVEKKPNIFKRIAMRLSSSNKKSKTSKPQAPKPQPSKKPAPSMPTVPDIAPTAADSPAASDSDPGPSNPSITPNTDLTINETMPPETPASSEPAPVEEPKNVAPIILIKPDRKNPFVTLKDKFDSLDLRSKKLLLIAAGAIAVLIVIIIVAIALVPRTSKPDGLTDDPSEVSSTEIPPLEDTIDTGRGGNQYNGDNATSLEVNDLQSRVNSYAAASPEVRESAEEYQDLEGELLAMLPRIESERGTRDTVNYILTVVSLGRYYEARNERDKFIEVYNKAISETDNETSLAYYYSNLCRFYMYTNDKTSEKACLVKLLALDDSKIQLFTMENWEETKANFRSRYNEL